MDLKRPDRDYGSRFKIQKLAYLCKSMGIPIKYKFTLYLNGPYSTSLTRDYFQAPKMVENLEADYKFDEKDLNTLDKISE